MRMRLGAAAVRYQMPVLVLLACRIRLAPLFDKGDGEGGGTNDDELLGEAVRYGGGWETMAVCLASSRAGSDEMMRNDGDGGGSLFPMSHDVRFLSFLFSSLPRRSACLSRAWCGWIALIVCCSLFSVDCLGVIGYIISRAL